MDDINQNTSTVQDMHFCGFMKLLGNLQGGLVADSITLFPDRQTVSGRSLSLTRSLVSLNTHWDSPVTFSIFILHQFIKKMRKTKEKEIVEHKCPCHIYI